MLMMSAALMSAPGLGRPMAKAQVQDSEVPSQSVEKVEFVEAGIVRQNRRIRVQGHSRLESIRLWCEQHASSPRDSRTDWLNQSLDWPGHRLPNGLLAPLRT